MSNGDFDAIRQCGQLWLEMLGQSASLLAQAGPGAAPTETARQIRGAIFKTMAEQLEQFMRSETFLVAMKQSLDGVLNVQKQYQTVMTEARHATEGVASADIDAAMQLIQKMEGRLLDRLEDLDEQLKQIGRRMDRLEMGAEKPVSTP